MNVSVLAAACVVLALVDAACGDGSGSEPPSASRSSTSTPSSDPDSEHSPSTSALADDFSDPSTGWDATGAAQYRDGELVVGDDAPAGMLVPSPLAFNGPRVLTATASIDGPGQSVIGLFCGGNLKLTSAYVGFVDPQKELAEIGRLSASGGAEIKGRGRHIDEVVSLDQPFTLELSCARKDGVEQITFRSTAYG